MSENTDSADSKENPPAWYKITAETLNRLIPNAGNCLACGTLGAGKVVLGAQMVTPVITDPKGSVSIGGSTMPQVTLICTNCGFTRYFNYLILQHQFEQGDAAHATE